ncbi:MAG: DUF192 domain-containing protein [Deltaproteobacteria bacterium]|nr:MAG: DUF192 domain-containing protein [Deltaproteobacteria bacterium]
MRSTRKVLQQARAPLPVLVLALAGFGPMTNGCTRTATEASRVEASASPPGAGLAREGGASPGPREPVRFDFAALEPAPSRVSTSVLERQHPGVVPGDACVRDAQCRSPLRCLHDRCGFPPAMTGEVLPGTPRIAFPEARTAPVFHLEVAVGAAQQARGLMHRRSMVEDFGMIFWYEADQPLSFWMENTLIPLDLIFIDDALEIVHIEHEAEPLTRTPRRSTRPARYVVEISGGRSAELGIATGQHVAFEGLGAAVRAASP